MELKYLQKSEVHVRSMKPDVGYQPWKTLHQHYSLGCSQQVDSENLLGVIGSPALVVQLLGPYQQEHQPLEKMNLQVQEVNAVNDREKPLLKLRIYFYHCIKYNTAHDWLLIWKVGN